METLLEKSCEVIKSAGKALRNAAVPLAPGGSKQEPNKQGASFYTYSECPVRKGLLGVAPEIPWLAGAPDSPHYGASAQNGTYWACHPVNGAVYLQQDFSPWCISLVLMNNCTPVFSIIYDPARDELFTAIRGQGAWLNGRKLVVNMRDTMPGAVLATAHPHQGQREMKKEITLLMASLERVLPRAGAVRMLGPSALQLAYVAAGRLDGVWEYGNDIFGWLAGSLMVEEAGGKVVSIGGGPFSLRSSSVLAANEKLVELIDEQLPLEWDILPGSLPVAS